MSAKAFFLVPIIGCMLMLIVWVISKPTYHKEGNLIQSVITYHKSNGGWHTVTCPVTAWEDALTGKLHKADEPIPYNTQVIIYPAQHCLDGISK